MTDEKLLTARSSSLLEAPKQWLKPWFESPEDFLLGAVGLMTLLGMVQSHSGPLKAIGLLLCIPVMLWLVIIKRRYTVLWTSAAVRWGLGLLLLYLLSTGWSFPSTHEAKIDVAKLAVETTLFVFVLFFAFRAGPHQKAKFGKLLIFACTVGSLLGLVSFYADHPIAARLHSTAYLLGYPTQAPTVLLACLITAGLLMEQVTAYRRGRWLVVGFIAVGAFAFMTQTRGTIISLGCLALLWGGYYLGVKKTIITGVVVGAVLLMAVVTTHSLDQAWTQHMATGLNGRLAIWKQVMLGFFNFPWFGHGAASIFTDSTTGRQAAAALGQQIVHPHGLPFSMLYYFGLAGLIVFIGYIATLAWGFWQCDNNMKWFGLFALLCLLLMTSSNMHTLVSEVSKQWWIWWLPSMAMLSVTQSEVIREHADK